MANTKDSYCQICGGLTLQSVVYEVDGYPICKCRSCDVGRVDIEHFDPSEYYDSGYFLGKYKHSYIDYLASEETLTREFKRTVEFVRANGPSLGKLLEIGCAYGFFLQEASRHYEVFGVEIAEDAARYCKSSGLSGVKSGVLEREDLARIGPLDVVVMLDVIEHIDNVEETIEMIAGSLRVGGSFVVTTGDWGSLLARAMGPKWRLMAPPMHLWYFSPENLMKLGQRFGLKMQSYSHPWKIVPLDLAIQQAGIMAGIKDRLRCPAWTKTLGIPANLYDAFRMVFSKV